MIMRNKINRKGNKMKRMIFIVVILGFSLSLQAKIGVGASYLYSNLSISEAKGQSAFSIGLMVKRGPVSIELNYCQKNAVIENVFIDFNYYTYRYTFNIKTGYIEIPLLVHFFEKAIYRSKISLYGGPAVNLCISDITALKDKNTTAIPRLGDPIYAYNFDRGGGLYKAGNSTVGYRLGAEFFNKRYIIGFRYDREFLGGLRTVNYVIMKKERFHALEFYFKIVFGKGE